MTEDDKKTSPTGDDLSQMLRERDRCLKWARKLRMGEIDDVRSLISAIQFGWDPDQKGED